MTDRTEQFPTPDKPDWPKWARPFLEALATGVTHTTAAKLAQVSRTTPYRLCDQDPDFTAAYKQALDAGADMLVDEVRRRAFEGVDEPVIYQGQMQGSWVDGEGRPASAEDEGARFIPLTVKKYSDNLLMFLVKARRPEFRDKGTVELSGPGGGPMQLQHQAKVDVHAHIEQYAGEFLAAAEHQLREEACRASGLPASGLPPHGP
jgi:hypothetical protein